MNNSSEKTNIIAWLSKFRINNYNLVFDEINQEYVINVDGNVPLHAYKLDILPFKFGKVTGDFDVAINCLDCLNNCPDYVGGSFSATDNNLTDLKYLPKFITITHTKRRAQNLCDYLNDLANYGVQGVNSHR